MATEQEFKVDCVPHQDSGGQHVGVGVQTIVVTHTPTKQSVGVSTINRSQHKALTLAMLLLEMLLEEQ